ncbi:MAG: nucleotidyltransferase domain-containing protein [Candidatus Woesearchaeota archaeon]
MAKRKEAAKEEKYEEKKYEKKEAKEPELPANLSQEVAEKLKNIKEKITAFQKKIVEKFDKYVVGVALLPPPRPPAPNLPPDVFADEQKRYEQEKDKYATLVLIDDTEPTKMTKGELRDKLSAIMDATAKEIDPNILPQTLLLSELWQNCYDGKYDLLQLIGMSAPIYDTGMLGAIRIAEVHKSMVLKKFEKYIVAYVMAGSLVQGRATKDSDIDVFIVIDDTDVKKMTRAELRDKLRAIIIGMGVEAGEITGIRNKINIQIYILTDFWDSIRESNPVIFTFLRDGVPFYDRGIFMPWKQLLKMGKIKPSAEAIDIFMSSGEQTLDRVKFKLRDIGTEDFFWGIHTPTQAALMLYGIPPPAPKETCGVLREVFVKKEGLLEEEYVKILENVIQVRKDIEHGVKKDITGKEIDKLLEDSEKYMKRLKRLFTQIEKLKEEESMLNTYDTMQTILRDVLKMEGVESIPEKEITHLFEEKLISTGKIPAKFLRNLHDLVKAKADYDAGKLSKTEVEKVQKESNELIRFLIDYMHRRKAHELERAKLRIKHGQKYGEITLLGNTAFIVRDMDSPDKIIEKAPVNPDGSLGNSGPCTPEDFEQALAKLVPTRAVLKEPLFESLKRFFGRDYELII